MPPLTVVTVVEPGYGRSLAMPPKSTTEAWDEDLDGNSPTPNLITSRDALRWGTIDGSAVNVAPVIDPVAAVVCAADISNVDTVIVNGAIMKRNGKLLADLSGPRRDVLASRDYLVGKFGTPEPGWLPAKS